MRLLCILLTVLLVALKLVGIVTMSWWLVWTPMLVLAGIVLTSLIVLLGATVAIAKPA